MRIPNYLLLTCLLTSAWSAQIGVAKDALRLTDDDVVVFLGGTNMLRIQQAGYLETLLTKYAAPARPRFRDLSWEADTVFQQGTVIERWRRKAHFGELGGLGDLAAQLRDLQATVIVVQFGLLESFAKHDGIEDFTRAYNALLDVCQQETRDIIVLTPCRFETPTEPLVPDLAERNANLALYVAAIEQLARTRDIPCVRLYDTFLSNHTDNGMHLRPAVQGKLAQAIAHQLHVPTIEQHELDPLRAAVVEKHRLWYDYWRPANWKLIYGDDAKRQFTRGGQESPSLQAEWKQLLPKIAQAEQRVWQIAAGGPDTGHARPEPETLHGDPSANIAQELAAFSTPEGLQVNLFASEEEGLTSPLAVRWDPAGRMYVTVTTTYPHVFPGDLPNDKVILLEDTDHDGVADRSTVFADRLNIPTGIEWGDGGLYVGQNTELLFLKDHDGDGKADERRVVLSGFGNGDSHQTINSFVWSPDGELHFGHGDGCESRVETPWGASHLFNAGFYRFRPKRLQLLPYLEGHMGPGNPWGIAFDNWGQIFNVDGAGGVNWLSPALVSTTHRRRLSRIGDPGGYCGIGFLDGQHLPEAMHGDFAIGDYKSNRVKRFGLQAQGAGFRLDWKEPLLESRHRNFRPIDVRVGPDGAVYVVDWYNPITCHQDDAYRDPTRDKAHGRIWRISSKKEVPYPSNLAKAPASQLARSLGADARWTRYQAKREMTTRNRDTMKKAIGDWIHTLDPRQPRYEHHLFEALSAYATIECVAPALLSRSLQAADPRARAFATRLVGRWHDRLDDPLALLSARVIDTNPRVRMEAVVACSAIPSARAISVAALVLDQPRDRWIDYVFAQTVHCLKPWWMPALQQGELSFTRASHLAAVLNESGGREVRDNLKALVARPNLPPELREKAIQTLLSVGDAEELTEYGLRQATFGQGDAYDPTAHAQALRHMARVARERQIQPTGDFGSALQTLIKHENPLLRASVLELCGIWRVSKLADQVLALCDSPDAPLQVRTAAIMACAEMEHPQAVTTLQRLAASDQAPAVRSAAIRGLASIELPAAVNLTVPFLRDVDHEQEEFAAVVKTLLDQQGATSVLAQELQRQPLPPAKAKQLLLTVFTTGRTEQSLLAAINHTLGATAQTPGYSAAYIERLTVATAQRGDAARGSQIFRSMACTACHKIGGTGGTIGPDLSALGTTLSPARITEEVLWPGRQVKEGYSLVTVLTDDGKIHRGYERKTADSATESQLVLEDIATRKLLRIPAERIEERRLAGSAMPEGITALLTEDQLLDLLRYLTDLGKIQ